MFLLLLFYNLWVFKHSNQTNSILDHNWLVALWICNKLSLVNLQTKKLSKLSITFPNALKKNSLKRKHNRDNDDDNENDNYNFIHTNNTKNNNAVKIKENYDTNFIFGFSLFLFLEFSCKYINLEMISSLSCWKD